MARPVSKEVPYFPFLVKDGKTLFILEGKYQCKGTGFFTNVLRFLSSTPDHHFCIEDEGDKLFFFSKTKCDEESGMDMLNIMVATGKLDRGLWRKKLVIASQSFLESIEDAYKNRKNNIITMDEIREVYNVSSVRNPQVDGFPSEETQCHGDNCWVSSDNNLQSKVKKSKVIYTPFFESFWKIYPKKNVKKKAFQEWKKIKPPENVVDLLKKQIEHKEKMRKEKMFVPEWPDPERYIKYERWDDELEPIIQGNEPEQGSGTQACRKCKTTKWVRLNANGYCEKCQ